MTTITGTNGAASAAATDKKYGFAALGAMLLGGNVSAAPRRRALSTRRWAL